MGAADAGSADEPRALVAPQSGSAMVEAQAVRVVPGLAGLAIGLPVRHRGAGGIKAFGLDRRVQPRMPRQGLDQSGKVRAGPAAAQTRDHLVG
jgi:hypothetical protein